MNNQERLGGGEERKSGWESLAEYGEQHPFETKAETRSQTWRERRGERKLLKRVAKEHPEIYEDSDALMEENTEPYLERIRQDEAVVVGLGRALESRADLRAGTEKAAEYFCQQFGVEMPTLKIYEDEEEKVRSASYDEEMDVMSVNTAQMASPAELLGTVAHELWHKRQYGVGGEAYELNFEYYFLPEWDYEAFRRQLIENEAFRIGEEVAEMSRKAYAEEHPELRRGIWTERQLKKAWLDREYVAVARGRR